MKVLTKFLNISIGFERLFFFVVILMLAIHLSACFWLFTASLNATEIHTDGHNEEIEHKTFELVYNDTWLSNFDYHKMDDSDLYYLAIYWAV